MENCNQDYKFSDRFYYGAKLMRILAAQEFKYFDSIMDNEKEIEIKLGYLSDLEPSKEYSDLVKAIRKVKSLEKNIEDILEGMEGNESTYNR